jgi:hypothetical protein
MGQGREVLGGQAGVIRKIASRYSTVRVMGGGPGPHPRFRSTSVSGRSVAGLPQQFGARSSLFCSRSGQRNRACMLRPRPIASARHARGTLVAQIPIAEPAARSTERTSRDFVPWRFSDAGRQSAWSDQRCRRPKTCTLPAQLRTLVDATRSPRRRGRAAFNQPTVRAARKVRNPLLPESASLPRSRRIDHAQRRAA